MVVILLSEYDADVAEMIRAHAEQNGHTVVHDPDGADLERILSLLRSGSPPPVDADRLVVGDHVLDAGRRTIAEPSGKVIRPTAREFDLAWYLAENTGIVLSRSQILDEVWGFDYRGESRTVDVHIRQLRKKLPLLTIETEWGVGYRMRSGPTGGGAYVAWNGRLSSPDSME